jgi:cytidine deaminase
VKRQNSKNFLLDLIHMKINTYLIHRAIKKALISNCRYKISALGFNYKGDMIYSSFNKKRFPRIGGGIHAEMAVMAKYGRLIKTILICRVNKSGNLLPIHPCKICKTKAEELGIKILTIDEI